MRGHANMAHPRCSDVDEVGRIYGDVGLGLFHLLLSRPVERGDYITVEDELHGKVLCQLDDLRRKSDLDLVAPTSWATGPRL